MRLSRRSLIGCIGTMLLPGLASAATAAAPQAPRLPAAFRARLQAQMDRLGVPGLAVAAVRQGRVEYIDALGFASLPFQVPADERTLFHLGSIGKHFTAALVLRLEAAGKIGIDHAIGEYLKDIPAPFASCPIRTLLSHTSGIPDYDGLPGLEGDRSVSRGDFMQAIATRSPEFPPGEAWAYSNTNFVLLGRMAEDVTGQSYRELITQQLLNPAGMAEARVDDSAAVIRGRAEPYVRDGGQIRHAMQMDGEWSGWPDGGVIMSARDAARWEIGLQRGAPIGAAMMQRMTEPVILATGRSCGYGFAWFVDRMAGKPLYYHTGSVPGFIAIWLRFPQERVGVVAMVNMESDGARAVRRAAAFGLAEQLLPGSTCWSLPPMHDDAPALTRRIGRLIADGATAADAADFAPELQRLLGRSAFDLATGLGSRQPIEPGSVGLVEQFEEPGGAVLRRYRAALAGGAVFYDVGYDQSEKIFRVRDL